MFNNLMSISTFSIIFSLINALITVFFSYNYKKTNDTKWLKYITSIILIYLFIDLTLEINIGFNERITIIIHHLISIFFTLWARINNYGIYLLPEMVYAILITESSTIFLNINKLIKIYLDSNSNANSQSSLTSILKNVSTINYLFFLPLFVYFRNYKIFIDGIFNPDFYAKLLAPRDDIYYYLNRFVLLMLVALSALNIYWLIPIFKSTYKKLMHLFKCKPDKGIKKNENEDKKSSVDELIKEIDIDGDEDDEKEQENKEEVSNKKEEEVVKEEELVKEEEVVKEEEKKKKSKSSKI